MALTQKQENFCLKYVECGNASEAYRHAYNSKAKPESVHVRASELMSDSKVSVRIQELKGNLEEKALWTRQNSVEALKEVVARAMDADKYSDVTGAIKALNAMHGWDKQTVDHTSSDGSIGPTVIELVAPKVE